MRLLLEHTVSVDAKDDDGRTTLHTGAQGRCQREDYELEKRRCTWRLKMGTRQ
jgi:hypothetical protein